MAGPAQGPQANRWWPVLLVIAVGLVVLGVIQHPRAPLVALPSPTPQPSTTQQSTTRPTATTRSSRATASPTTPSVTTVGHPILGITAGWELFGRGVDDVVRIQFATGRITWTPYPGLASGGPVTLLAARSGAIIRPIDFVRGYAVPDQGRAVPLTGALASGGIVIPGAGDDRFWVETQDGSPGLDLILTDSRGRPLGPRVTGPDGISTLLPLPDGLGNVLFSTETGTYLGAKPGKPPRLVSTSPMFAVGPTQFLLKDCGRPPRCSLELLDRKTGILKTLLPSTKLQLFGSPGIISADGRTAAVVAYTGSDLFTPSLWLIDLRSGKLRAVLVAAGTLGAEWGSMVWSPDSRMLFIVTDDRRIAVIDPASAAVRDLGIGLPPIIQIALRSAR